MPSYAGQLKVNELKITYSSLLLMTVLNCELYAFHHVTLPGRALNNSLSLVPAVHVIAFSCQQLEILQIHSSMWHIFLIFIMNCTSQYGVLRTSLYMVFAQRKSNEMSRFRWDTCFFCDRAAILQPSIRTRSSHAPAYWLHWMGASHIFFILLSTSFIVSAGDPVNSC